MKDSGNQGGPFRRRVFYIPGYDPFHPRRYRELYRKEGAAQAGISGYALDLKPKRTGGTYGWHVLTDMDGAQATADIEVLVWHDIVKASMTGGIAATYGQLLRTAWAYVGSGALFRLARLRKGPVIAALYPIVMLTVQLLACILAGWGIGALFAGMLPDVVGTVTGWMVAPVVVVLGLRFFKRQEAGSSPIT